MWRRELLDAHAIQTHPALPRGEEALLLCFETNAPEYHVRWNLHTHPKAFLGSWCLWRLKDDAGYLYHLQVTVALSASRSTTTMSAKEHTLRIRRSLAQLLRPYDLWLLGAVSSKTLDLGLGLQDSPHS